MTDTPSAPVAECEPEWLARPVSDLASHIATFYHQHTREELLRLTHVAQRLVRTRGEARAPHVAGLVTLLAELHENVQTHAWAEGALIFPVLADHEHRTRPAHLRPESLDRFVAALADEHIRIRRTLAMITEQLHAGCPPAEDPFGEWSDLRGGVLRLRDHVLQELSFEERCLLPRVRLIARLARTPDRDLG